MPPAVASRPPGPTPESRNADDEASALAEGGGRLWRVARHDDTDFANTADLQPGRVTFEVDDGTVTAASIEQTNTDPPLGDPPTEGPARAQLIADALHRLVTTDSSFEGPNPFLDVYDETTTWPMRFTPPPSS